MDQVNETDETDLTEDQLAAMWDDATPTELASSRSVEVDFSPVLWEATTATQGSVLAYTSTENTIITQSKRQLIH